MSEPTPTPAPSPTPAPAPAAAATPDPAPSPEPVALVKPEFLPAEYWDDKAGIKTDEFAKHYTEISATAKAAAERAGTVPDKPDGYKVELVLPKEVVVPEGVKFDPAKDPRLPAFLQFAHDHKLPNELVNAFIAHDAQQALAEITSAQQANAARSAEWDKALGEKAKERRTAAWAWADGLKDKGFSPAQVNELHLLATSADGVTTAEKLMSLINGSVPGVTHDPPPATQPKTVAERLYPHLPSGLPPSSARSA